MKKLYSITLFLLALSACTKVPLREYEEAVVGSWELYDVDRVGGGSTSGLRIRDGKFQFDANGSMRYTDVNGNVYTGSWRMDRSWVRENCRYDNGYQECDSRHVKDLQISAIDFTNQRTIMEYFEEIRFTSETGFRAYLRTNDRRYVYYFRKQ